MPLIVDQVNAGSSPVLTPHGEGSAADGTAPVEGCRRRFESYSLPKYIVPWCNWQHA